MVFNQACGFQSATCSTHTVTVLNVEMFHETFELHTLLVAEVFASVLWIQIYLGHMLDAC
jgi:hypothetical protein